MPEWSAKYANAYKTVNLLNSLADRGIILNTWQANELACPGNRGMGKTFLAYVRMAESLLLIDRQRCPTTVNLVPKNNYTEFDPDITGHRMAQEFIRGFVYFIREYYNDKFSNPRIICGIDFEADLVHTKSTKRWWQ